MFFPQLQALTWQAYTEDLLCLDRTCTTYLFFLIWSNGERLHETVQLH